MRICMLARSLPVHTKGGMEDHIFTLCRGIVKAGHEVHVITAQNNMKSEEEIDGVNIHYIQNTDWRRYDKSYWEGSAKKFTELNAKRRFDVVHSQSVAGYGLIAKKINKKSNVPLVVSFHGTSIDEIKTAINTYLSPNPVKLARCLALCFYHYFFFLTKGKKIAMHADGIIATSNEQYKILAEKYDANQEKLHIVFNGIDVDLFRPGNTRSRSKEILAVCRLIEEKGVQFIIKALPSINEAKLVVIGDGPYTENLKKLATELHVDKRVEFLGYKKLEELPEYFNSCDVFVNATIRQNGYDLTILEAMACGKPVVVSRIGSVPTAVSDKEGYLFAPGNVRELAAAISSVLDDPKTAEAKGSNARQKIVESFSSDTMIKKTIDVYRSLKIND